MKGRIAWYPQRIPLHVRIDARIDRRFSGDAFPHRRESEAECVGKSPPPLRVVLSGFFLSLSSFFFLFDIGGIHRALGSVPSRMRGD